MYMQSLHVMCSHRCVTQSEDARNSFSCYIVEQYTVLGGKSVLNNCGVTLWLHATVASLPSFMALTAQNTSCHMFTWLWVSLRMILVSLLYFRVITFEDKLKIAISNARGLNAPACQCLFLSLCIIHEHIFPSHIHACFPHDCSVHLLNCFSLFFWRQLQRNTAVR